MTRLTKAQLLAKIEQLESELGLRDEQLAQARAEIDAYLVAQRPSRRASEGGRHADGFAHTVQLPDHPIVMLRGKPHMKVRAWENGRLVTTYKAVAYHRAGQ